MKKFLTIALLLASAAASADVLYWQINQNYADGNSGTTYYSLVRADLSGATTQYSDLLLVTYDGTAKKFTSDVGSWSLNFENYKDFTYTVELWQYAAASGDTAASQTKIYQYQSNSYESLVSAGAIYTGGTSLPTFSADPSIATAAPEPTSGVLLLFGLASLALKRKHV